MSATGTTPSPADLLAEAELELLGDDSGATGEPAVTQPAQVTIPDPEGVLGNRTCPVCSGAGEIPFEVPASPRYMACPDCKGTGNVLTGSFDPECAMILCERCNARGYVDRTSGEASVSLTNPHDEPPYPGMIFSEERGIWIWP